ncbi:MAG: sigma-70 family RNA polymerase sigma factor [Streptosporangiaceae bacterium]
MTRRLGADAADDIVAETFLLAFRHASKQVAAALARLPADSRDTLLLAAWSNLSYEEIADALGVPVGTVRSRLSRARGKLRRALGDVDPSAFAEEPQA